jgi:hypothetical protein
VALAKWEIPMTQKEKMKKEKEKRELENNN